MRGQLSGPGFICHVGWEVSTDVAHRLMDGVDADILTAAETAAATVPDVRHAHARPCWTGRSLCVEIEGGINPGTAVAHADRIGTAAVAAAVPDMRSFTWTTRPLHVSMTPIGGNQLDVEDNLADMRRDEHWKSTQVVKFERGPTSD